jgi:beta-glucanase (GH16 family)
VGSWDPGTDPNKIVYVGADGTQWRTYPSTYTDTYQKRPYRPAEVLSVSNGMMQFDLHNVQGQPAGANPSPLLASGSQYQTYGRYSARMRVDNPTLSEYHVAWLLWPQSENWPTDGEFDFPEGQLNATAEAFHHYARSSGGQDTVNTGASFNDWHTYTIEWSPGRVRFLLDDAVVLESTKYVPTKPMRWQLQTETNGNGTHRGNVLVDWVSVWSYAG